MYAAERGTTLACDGFNDAGRFLAPYIPRTSGLGLPVQMLLLAALSCRSADSAAGLTASLDDEIGLKESNLMDPDQFDRIGGREVDHGIPRDIIADRSLQGGPIAKTVGVHVDGVLLRRRVADS